MHPISLAAPTSDDELIRRAVAGDLAALGEVLLRAAPSVERGLRIGARWRAHIDTADVLQVTFLEAFMQIRRFDPQRGVSFLTWVRQIAANNLRDAIRSLQRRARNRVPAERLNGDSMGELLDSLAATTSTPSRQLARRELRAVFEQTLSQLPADYANVVRQYDLDGRTIDEVAADLGRSRGAIHMLRARAHDWLRELLGRSSHYFNSRA
ncbi:MAG: sigma-70 family RNA polymerase sigma factor [Phycisphaerae bacterium]